MTEKIHRRWSQIYPGSLYRGEEGISLPKRLDTTLPKLDQRLSSMSQAAPAQPTNRTINPFIRPTADRPTRDSSYKRSMHWFLVSWFESNHLMYPFFVWPATWLYTRIQTSYERTPTPPSDPHLSIWLSSESPFYLINFWVAVLDSCPQLTGQAWGIAHL